MAKRYRKKDRIQWSQRKIKQMLIITAILIVPPFVLWGISTAVRSNREFVVGKVGRWTITRPLWNRELNHTQIDYTLRWGNKNIPPELLKAFTWNRIISLYIAKKQKIKVSDKELAEWIQSLAVFQDPNGNFSIQRYQQIIRSLGIPEKAFEETIRENLMIEKLKEKVTRDVSVSNEEILEAWKNQQEKFKIRFHPIWTNRIKSQMPVNESEVKEYYEKHKEELIIPESVDVEYIIIPKEKYSPQLQNKSFEQITKELKIEPSKKERLRSDQILPDIGPSKEFYSYAFSLSKGKTSPIFQLPNGNYCILKVLNHTPKHIGSLEEVKESIKNQIQEKKAIEQARETAKQLIKEPENIKDWENVEEFSADTPYLPLIGGTDPLIKELRRAIKEGKRILIIEGPNAVFVVEILNHVSPPKEIPDEKEEQLKKELLNLKKERAFQEFMLKEMDRLQIIRKDNT